MTQSTSQKIVDDLVASTMDILTVCRDKFSMQFPVVCELSWQDGTRIVFRAHPHGGLEFLSAPGDGANLGFPCEVDIRDINGAHKNFTMIMDPIPVVTPVQSFMVH